MSEPEKQPSGEREFGDDSTPEAYANSKYWQILWPRVIARAWASKYFKDKLLANPRETLEHYFGYELNKELEVNVVEAPRNAYNPDDRKDPWKALQYHKLELVIPPAPPVEQQAIALADYADTGRTYPMTSGG